jgi:hypothetical protein
MSCTTNYGGWSSDMDKITVHVTFLDSGGEIVKYQKVDPSERVEVPNSASSLLVNATFDER